MMRTQLEPIKQAESQLEQIDERLRGKLAPYAGPLAWLMQIPGVEWITAATIIAEIGVDMSAFISGEHLASWAGILPWRKTGKVR
jgi:transposase